MDGTVPAAATSPDAISYEEGWVPAGERRLFRRGWRPALPTAALVNLHGLGDHSGLYEPLAAALAVEGIAVHAPDLPGHGRSPGQRAYVERWDEYLDALDAFTGWVAAREPELPLFILGHSLGGLISLDYAIRRPGHLAGLITAAPPLGEVGVPRVLMLLGRIFARIWPRFAMNVGMDLSGLSRDPAVVETITRDPLFHRRGTARLAADVPAAIARVHEHAEELRVPLLLLHGTADRMVPPDGTTALHERLSDASDVTLRLYDGAYHALFFDTDGEQVRRDVIEWIRAHGG